MVTMLLAIPPSVENGQWPFRKVTNPSLTVIVRALAYNPVVHIRVSILRTGDYPMVR